MAETCPVTDALGLFKLRIRFVRGHCVRSTPDETSLKARAPRSIMVWLLAARFTTVEWAGTGAKWLLVVVVVFYLGTFYNILLTLAVPVFLQQSIKSKV